MVSLCGNVGVRPLPQDAVWCACRRVPFCANASCVGEASSASSSLALLARFVAVLRTHGSCGKRVSANRGSAASAGIPIAQLGAACLEGSREGGLRTWRMKRPKPGETRATTISTSAPSSPSIRSTSSSQTTSTPGPRKRGERFLEHKSAERRRSRLRTSWLHPRWVGLSLHALDHDLRAWPCVSTYPTVCVIE